MKSLRLASNELGDKGVKYVCKVLDANAEECAFTDLDLSDCGITDTGTREASNNNNTTLSTALKPSSSHTCGLGNFLRLQVPRGDPAIPPYAGFREPEWQ